jgi:predicted metal-dependent peptidase
MSLASQKIDRCSAQMLLQFPWWASLYLHLARIETEAVPTMAVDGTRFFYNPAFTESLSDKQCIGCMMHETAHCAFLHCFRRKYREPRRWNVACDKVVNAALVAAHITLPAGGVPPGPLGSLAEELYDHITDQEMALYCMDILELPGADGKSMSEKDWRDAIAASHGLVPAYIARTIEEATASPKNWREELARFIHAHRKAYTRTWTRPSRRIVGLPGWNRDIVTTIVLCIDTSGSISEQQLGMFIAECRSILEIAGVSAVIISADATVSQVLQPGDTLPVTLIGGGGTDFAPALKEAEKYIPDGIVYLTDGDGEYPQNCLYPVLWALTRARKVPFGEVVLLDEAAGADDEETQV